MKPSSLCVLMAAAVCLGVVQANASDSAKVRRGAHVLPGEPQSSAPDAYEKDDTWQQAKPLVLGTYQDHNFFDDAVDWVQVDAKRGETYTLETTVYRKCDTVMELWCRNQLMMSNDDKSSKDVGSIMHFKANEDCRLYVKVMSKNGKTGPGLPYTLSYICMGGKAPKPAQPPSTPDTNPKPQPQPQPIPQPDPNPDPDPNPPTPEPPGDNDPENSNKKGWTAMIYMDADNEQDASVQDDLNEIENVGSHAHFNTVVFLKTPKKAGYYAMVDGRLVEKKKIKNPNMGDIRAGKAFIDWTTQNYPANNYMFTFWGEGMSVDRGTCPDKSHGDYLTEAEQEALLAHGVKKMGKKFGVVGYDMSLMASGELFYQLRNVADFVVASEQTCLKNHWNYDCLTIMKDKALTPKSFAAHLVTHYAKSFKAWTDLTISAVDCAKAADFSKALNGFCVAAMNSNADAALFNAPLPHVAVFGDSKTRDLVFYLRKIGTTKGIPQMVKDKSEALINIITKDYVVQEWHGENWADKAYGLSMIMKGDTDKYKQHALCKESRWNDFCEFAGFPKE